MRIEYYCRHCKQYVGELDRPTWNKADAERYCGFQSLTPVERSESIAYNDDRGVMFVQTVCDHCQRAVEAHPELLVEGSLFQ